MLPVKSESPGLSDVIAKKMANLKEVNGEEKKEGEKEFSEKELIAAELMHAIDTRDPKLAAQVLEDFFAICDAEPHEEGEHKEEHGPGAFLISGEI